MWDDIKIGGTGERNEFGCTAIKVFNLEFSGISENRISYWITDCIGDMGMQVMKDTKEGETIKIMIEEKWSKKKMLNYFNRLLLKKVSPTKIIAVMKNIENEAYRKGKRDKEIEIQNALGLTSRYF